MLINNKFALKAIYYNSLTLGIVTAPQHIRMRAIDVNVSVVISFPKGSLGFRRFIQRVWSESNRPSSEGYTAG
jgi:hypothetical protein